MRDDEIRRLLTDANPWWRAAANANDPTLWAASHRLLRDRASYDLGYRAGVFSDIATGPVSDSLVVLTGPRRVGKSVALLDLAVSLCQRQDVDPRQIIHIPCDSMHQRDLRRTLTLGRNLTQVVDEPDEQRRIWLFDEIGAIAGWTSILKEARDGTSFGDDTVVVTGSRWIAEDEVRGNLLTGRAGSGGRRVRHLFPLTFREFATVTGTNLALPPTVHPSDLQAPEVRAALAALVYDVDAYDLAWQSYLTCGGFPRAVAEYQRQGAVSNAYLRDLEAWLRQDIDPDTGPQPVPQLLAELASRMSSPLSVRSTADALGYGRDALTTRLHRLTASFGAVWCHQRDDSGRRVPSSKSKLYLVDPLLAHLPSGLRAGLDPPNMTTLSEAALGVALARAIDNLEEGRWVSGDTIGYVRTGSGNEVDLGPVPVPAPSGPRDTVPIESKWVDAGARSDSKTIEGRFGLGVVATKSLLDIDHPSWAVPAGLVAALLA